MAETENPAIVPPTNIDPASLRIEAGYLVEVVSGCTCGGADISGGFAHERGCGLEPLMTVAELAQLLRVMTETEDAPATAAELPSLPEPDQWTLEDGHAIPFWSAGLGVTAWRGGVEIGDGDFREDLDAVERDALATLAAIRYARRFAAQGESEMRDG